MSRKKPEKPSESGDFGKVRLTQRLRQATGLTLKEFLEKIPGMKEGTLRTYAEGRHSPPLGELLKIAKAADVTLDWLILGRGPMRPRDAKARSLSGDEVLKLVEHMCRDQTQVTLRTVRALLHGEVDGGAESAVPPEERADAGTAFEVARLFEPGFREVAAEEIPKDTDWRAKFVPIIGRLAAGKGVETLEAEAHPPGIADSYVAYESVPRGAFAVRVHGDSMAPDYQSGDVVIVDPSRPATEGVCCVIFDADGERLARLKRLKRRGKTAVLESLNPEYSPERLPLAGITAYTVVDHLPAILERRPK